MLPPHAQRIYNYLKKIDEMGGKASRMDFLRIAGNERNLDRFVKYLVSRKLIVEEVSSDKIYYSKSEIGARLLSALNDHEYVGPLFEELARSRMGPPQT
jgi:hypothetical protein